MNRITRNKSTAFDIYALFIYATLIVDLYRKFSAEVVRLPLAATSFRNVVYIVLFLSLLLTERRLARYMKLLVIGACFTVFTLISWLINYERGALNLYIDLIFMFISRLLPAYYIGTMLVGNEGKLREAVNKYQWLSVLYMALILVYPEVSEESYITISNNLLIPALLAFFCGRKGVKGLVTRGIGVAGLAVILIYGGRTSMMAVLAAVVLLLLIWLNENRTIGKVIGVVALIAAGIVLLVTYESIIDALLRQNPDSRTLKLLAKGEFLWMSNREDYYKAAWNSIVEHPFRIYGFLGDRFYYADVFRSISDNAVIATMFSHNSALELLLNFGVISGVCIVVYFVAKIVKAARVLHLRGDMTAWTVHLILFGCAFVPTMVSSSWLNDPSIWITMGAALTLASNKERSVSAQK